MFRSRVINLMVCFSLLSLTALPWALHPCCCETGVKISLETTGAACCKKQTRPKSCCESSNGIKSCPLKLSFGPSCPVCACKEKIKTSLTMGPSLQKTLVRHAATTMAFTSPVSSPIRTEQSRVIFVDPHPPRIVILLQTSILLC
jgi:hypothetical protein